ncbi:uncharacterized protein TNCV_1757181 [Trichonephila clavipes]|nr:uncharacterized protein TNCV_1757181 [Trichonephila clavipes]
MFPSSLNSIFEISTQIRKMQYVKLYGHGDSKSFHAVKNDYGENSVNKFECIQKRVGSRIRKLKLKQKDMGGRGKLTDSFFDKLQNYYSVASICNVNNIEKMQHAVIAAFFHCCSNKNQPMHGQCPVEPDSWCKFQRATFDGNMHIDTGKELPLEIIKIIKPHYMKLCDKHLLNKCLHGKTQNANESFNGILWKFIPKDIFVELQTHIAVIQFNKCFRGLLDVLNQAQVQVGANTEKGFDQLDEQRVSESKRHSLSEVKTSRKKIGHERKEN